jgi:RHS repeat-associated protein
VSSGGTSYSYDARGFLKSTTVGGNVSAYGYDALGNLKDVSLATRHISYLVDGRNRRIGKTLNGALVAGFLYGQEEGPLAETDGHGSVTERFVYGSNPVVPDYLVKGGVEYRLITDEIGSVRLVVNASTGQIAQRLDYDPWGNVTQDTNPGFQPFGFAGGLYDADTGLVRFGARDYDPATGRWLARDPILFSGGQANIYAYAGDDPVNFNDPSGLESSSGCNQFAEIVHWSFVDSPPAMLEHLAFIGVANVFADAGGAIVDILYTTPYYFITGDFPNYDGHGRYQDASDLIQDQFNDVYLETLGLKEEPKGGEEKPPANCGCP